MALKDGERFTQFRARVMDPISPTFCAAKWFNSTIWLGTGSTASCHLPPAHRIPLAEIKADPSALHNTVHKKIARAQMLKGERPAECEYCWRLEDLNRDHMSDRLFKTAAFSEADIGEAASASPLANAKPRTLEIAFDRNCQFACSYCNASFSTRWGKDISQNGPYLNLGSDGGGAYRHDGSWAEQLEDDNPYLTAFWKWWPEIKNELHELRITGGEPLLSKSFWKFMQLLSEDPAPRFRLAVNTNLGASMDLVDKLVDHARHVPSLHVYTSCESTGAQAEYIRDGLNYARFVEAVEKLLKADGIEQVHIMLTVSALALSGLPEFLDQILEWKSRRPERGPNMSLNILRFPSFMSPLVLPMAYRQSAVMRLQAWLEKNASTPHFYQFERESVLRLVTYLNESQAPHQGASALTELELDFRSFFDQYDQRRGKSFVTTFPEWAEWYAAIPKRELQNDRGLESGDSTKGWHNLKELRKLAEREGLTYPE